MTRDDELLAWIEALFSHRKACAVTPCARCEAAQALSEDLTVRLFTTHVYPQHTLKFRKKKK